MDLVIEHSAMPAPGGRLASVWRTPPGEVAARSYVDGTRRWLRWRDVALFLNVAGDASVRAWPVNRGEAARVHDEFASEVAPIFMQAAGAEALHASATLGPQGLLVFCGLSHAGKSTLACAVAGDDFDWFADDQVVIDVVPTGALAQPRRFATNLRVASRAHLGVANAVVEPVHAVGVPLAAIVIVAPRSSPGFDLTRVAPARAFSAVLPHGHCFDLEARDRFVGNYLRLVEQVPVFELAYFKSFTLLDEIVPAVRALPDERR